MLISYSLSSDGVQIHALTINWFVWRCSFKCYHAQNYRGRQIAPIDIKYMKIESKSIETSHHLLEGLCHLSDEVRNEYTK